MPTAGKGRALGLLVAIRGQGFHCPEPALQCHLSAFPWKDSGRRGTILAICVDAFINVISVHRKYAENQTVIVETLQLHNVPSP